MSVFLRGIIISAIVGHGPAFANGGQIRFVESNHASTAVSEQSAQSALSGKVFRAPLTEDQIDGPSWTSFVVYAAKGAAASGQEQPTYSLLVMIMHSANRNDSWRKYQGLKISLRGQDVQGVGEAALQTNSPQYLIVFTGSNIVMFSAKVPPTKNALAAEKQVALDVLRKL